MRPQPQATSNSTPGVPSNPSRKLTSAVISPDLRDEVVPQQDVAPLNEVIQREFEQLRIQLLAARASPNLPPPPPPVTVVVDALTRIWSQGPFWVFSWAILAIAILLPLLGRTSVHSVNDGLRTEASMQMARISVLEQETRQLRAENQALWTALGQIESNLGVRTELSAANWELERVYAERQGLWEERQGLWEERADLWRERQSLWDERDELWSVRDKLVEQVKLLEAEIERHQNHHRI